MRNRKEKNMKKAVIKSGLLVGKLVDWIWILFARTVLFLLTHILYHPKVYYEQKGSPRRGVKEPTVVTCNHLRGCDGAVIQVIFYRTKLHSITADKWYRKWYMRPLFECGYSIPINHTTTWLRKSMACIKKGDSILIFPEGKAVPGKQMAEFKPGFLMLATKAEVPILPLYMEGCYNRPFFKRLRIVVGTSYIPDPPLEGETTLSHTYLDRQCKILFEKTVALRDLLWSRRRRKEKR